jgi:ATP-dependent Clp protease ATP-binding subunit ClpC
MKEGSRGIICPPEEELRERWDGTEALRVITHVSKEAARLGHSYVSSELLFLALLETKTPTTGGDYVRYRKVTTRRLRKLVRERCRWLIPSRRSPSLFRRGSKKPSFTPPTLEYSIVLSLAHMEAESLLRQVILDDLFVGITDASGSNAYWLMMNLGLEPLTLQLLIRKAYLAGGETPKAKESSRKKKPLLTPALDEFGLDLTKCAREGSISPLVGREEELGRLVQVLGRCRKSNPVLVGEAGVGKTVMVEGLSQRIVDSLVPPALLGKRIVSLDLSVLVAGAKFRGDFEDRLHAVLNEVKASGGEIVLFVDEVHQLVGAGGGEGAMDASNILKPLLARGGFQCIGATTFEEYRSSIAEDSALVRRFQIVKLGESSSEDSVEILYGLRHEYEKHYGLVVSDEAVEASVKLSKRYIPGRFLPDKAIDLMDESCSVVAMGECASKEVTLLKEELSQLASWRNRMRGRVDVDGREIQCEDLKLRARIKAYSRMTGGDGDSVIVTGDDVSRCVAKLTDIPVNKLEGDEMKKLLALEETLSTSVIGQKEAVRAVSDAVKRSRVGLKSPGRPIASLLFSGPTGVGKTELCKALSLQVFGSENSLIRFDMSEYMSSHNVARLIGAPPGYVGYEEGGLLTEAVFNKPYSVVLFDEIEKADKSIFDIMLQVLDDARLTDSKGKVVSFTETIIIITSNLGSQFIQDFEGGMGSELLGDDSSTNYEKVKSGVIGELKGKFRPEFINRLDEVVVFSRLKKSEVGRIAKILVDEFGKRVKDAKDITIETTLSFMELLLDEGYEPSYGARPLRRAVTRLLENEFAQALLEERIQPGDTVIVNVGDGDKVILTPMPEGFGSYVGPHKVHV